MLIVESSDDGIILLDDLNLLLCTHVKNQLQFLIQNFDGYSIFHLAETS